MLSWFLYGPLLRRMSCQLESVVVKTAHLVMIKRQAEKPERACKSPPKHCGLCPPNYGTPTKVYTIS